NVSIAEKKANSAMAAWETARKTDRQFRRYDHPQTLRRLLITAEKTELDLKRNIVKAESDRVQAERRYRKLVRDKTNIEERMIEVEEQYLEELETQEEEYLTTTERLEQRLTELREDLAGLVLRAPIDGLVSIGPPPRRGRQSKELTIGTKVSPKEIVARIPDLTQFLVRCEIPEIYRSRINTGQTALLKNAALPELEMQGQIQEIASMSSRVLHWDPRSPRVYLTTISTDSSDPRLVPGMTVEVEILVERVVDTLHIPIEAVYNNEGKSYCKVKRKFSIEEQEIETGRASNSYVEILNGLEVGDSVLLHTSATTGKAGS
ncbi:MAG: efflux RND transporter periplasmic adaptor subunit, partial [Coraliomargarita sp.]